jgi:hypothetical protein
MQQAIFEHFPTINASYNFTNRDSDRLFSRKCVERLSKRVLGMIRHNSLRCGAKTS